jgi:hypothetical protein
LPGQRGASLLEDCLLDAIAAYHKAELDEEEPVEPVHAYVQALVKRASDVFELTVSARVENGLVEWDPLVEPLAAFCKRYSDCSVSVDRRPRAPSEEVAGESALLLGVRLLPEYVGRHLVREVVRNVQAKGLIQHGA